MKIIERWRTRRWCFHHSTSTVSPLGDRVAARSYIKSELVDAGRRKRFWCTICGKVWIF